MIEPRTGPANAVTSEEGHRWYVFGEGEHEERFVSVTTALGLVDKEGLRRWATSLSATAALDQLPKLIRATRTKDCGNTWKRCQHDFRVRCATCPCEQCMPCVRKWIANRHYYESSRRADEGSRVHDVEEHWVLNGGELRPHDEDVTEYVKQFLQWVADYQLTPDDWEMAEATVISRQYGYAGTLDAIVVFHADRGELCAQLVARVLGIPVSQTADKSVRLLVDTKTREKEEARLYPEHALQQSGYLNAEVVRLRDGREMPLPRADGAAILQVRPDGYLFQPVVTDDRTFGAFLSVLAFAKWHFEHATASVSSRSFAVPKEPEQPKPAKTPPAKKTAARKATPRKLSVVKAAEPEALIAAPEAKPVKAVAAGQSATLRSMTRPAHPDSPYGDDIPF